MIFLFFSLFFSHSPLLGNFSLSARHDLLPLFLVQNSSKVSQELCSKTPAVMLLRDRRCLKHHPSAQLLIGVPRDCGDSAIKQALYVFYLESGRFSYHIPVQILSGLLVVGAT